MEFDRCVIAGLYFSLFAVWKQSEMLKKEKKQQCTAELNVVIKKINKINHDDFSIIRFALQLAD